jgi:hypothetical protein
VLAEWVRRRVGAHALEPRVLVSLLGCCMTLRLVFEVNLYGYYLMAAAVLLVVLDVVAARIRASTIVWLVAAALAFWSLPGMRAPLGSHVPMWMLQLLLVGTAVALFGHDLAESLHAPRDRAGSRTPGLSVTTIAP